MNYLLYLCMFLVGLWILCWSCGTPKEFYSSGQDLTQLIRPKEIPVMTDDPKLNGFERPLFGDLNTLRSDRVGMDRHLPIQTSGICSPPVTPNQACDQLSPPRIEVAYEDDKI